ncbi:SRP68 [Symbiodinium sp. CCMP2456]|nr:SRP68 [Symbiodinium sp. CCMP2456]
MASEEVPEVQTQEPEAKAHDPFAVKILTTVQVHRSLNGLRHNDHLRYRQYCSRRLRRLYVQLRFKHGKGRFKQATFPENFDDPKWIFIPLVQSERAWAFGVQLKADNAAAAAFNARWRHHSERKLAKACEYAKQLEAVCKVHCDQRTQLEAEAYAAFMSGTWLTERENWTEAKTKLARSKKLFEHFLLAADQAEASAFRTYLQELAPMLRECRYNLGEAEQDEDGLGKATATGVDKGRDGDLVFRSHAVSIPSEKIRSKVMKCFEMTKALQAEADSTENPPGAVFAEKYGELSVEYGDALKDVHSEMIAAGADSDTADWRIVEAFIREASSCVSVERNLILLRSHLGKLDEIEDVSTIESRRQCRPEEGMRFCELVKEELATLSQLPESSEDIEETFGVYKKVILDYRCLYLALCHAALGKLLEAAALLEMLTSRVDEAPGKEQPGLLLRLQGLFQHIQQQLPLRVARWRCRILVQLAKASKKKKKDAEAEETADLVQPKNPKQDVLATFPPRFRDVPCKPLLFDLAFPCIEAPDLEAILPKKQEGKGRQAVAAVAGALGGLGSRLGGWMGRK